jgi:hypothetical protein
MKPAAGDSTEPMEVDGATTNPEDTAAAQSTITNKHQAKAARAKSPMAGGSGKAAKKTGKAAGKAGKMPYSPSQSQRDWSENLGGVAGLMSGEPSKNLEEQQQVSDEPPPTPPPTDAHKEAVEAGSAGEETKTVAGPSRSASAAGSTGGGKEHARLDQVSNQAADYVSRKRMEDIKTRLGKDHMVYQSIRARNICATKAANLMGGGAAFSPAVPGMVELGDGRVMTGGLKMALTDKRIITSSVNLNWTCLVCEQHRDKPALRLRGEAGCGETQAIILSDQNFPAVLPVNSTEQCFKIIRIENGSLLELVDELLNMIGNRRVPAGSIVLLHSPTHLANVGLTAYVADLLRATKMIQDRLGKETRVAPAPPLLLAGCGDSSTIRELYEFTAWAADYYRETDCYLEASFALAKYQLTETGEGEQTDLAMRRFRLPSPRGEEEKLWFSGGVFRGSSTTPIAIPAKVKPAPQKMENALVIEMIKELRSKLALDLDPSPAFERGLGLQSSPKKAVDFMVVGSSNASKLAKALEDRGFSVCLVFRANWRITRSNVEHLTVDVGNAIQDMDPATIIYQFLDSSSYYGRARDGSRMAPRRDDDDGKFHLVGDVTVSSKETQLEQFNDLKPLLRLAAKRRCIVITPLPRYVNAGCCLNPDHCSNRRYQDFRQHMLDTLEMLRKNYKDFLYYEGMKSIKVLDPCIDLRGLDETEVWDNDPVHPQPLVYTRIATAVIKMINSMSENDNKRRRTDSLEGPSMSGNDARRGRHDAALREEWRDSERVRGRGRGEWRARGRGFGGGDRRAGGRGYGGGNRYY